jgi:hypothetical protein
MAKKKDEVVEAPKEDSYEVFHKKSMRQVALDAREQEKKDEEVASAKKDEEVGVSPVGEDTKKEPVQTPEPPKEDKVDVEKVKKEAKEEAEKIANEKVEATRKEFQAKIDEILNKDKSLEEKQKESDELVAIWDKEKRLPKDWKEIASEQLRISDAKVEQRLKAQEEARQKAEEERRQQETQAKETEAKTAAERQEAFNRQLADEMEEMYSSNFLKRPSTPEEINNENTTDEGAKETREVLKFGVKLNTERHEKGLQPVTSFSKIYFMYYKPFIEAQGKKDDQPAGADAPVSGAKMADVQPKSDGGYVYARDHGKSFRQIVQANIKRGS